MALQSHVQIFADKMKSATKPSYDAVRANGWAYFQKLGMPTRKDEAWKYTSVKPLKEDDFRPANQAKNLVPDDVKRIQSAKLPGFYNLVLVNGHWDRSLSDKKMPSGLKVETLSSMMSKGDKPLVVFKTARRKALGQVRQDALEALNAAFFGLGLFISVEKNTSLEQPLNLIHYSNEPLSKGTVYTRCYLNVGSGSRAHIFETTLFSGEGTVANIVNETIVGENSHLEYIRLVSDKSDAKQFYSGRVYLKRFAHFSSVTAALGGKLLRNHLDLHCLGSQATGKLLAISFADFEQQIDHQTLMDHVVGDCHTEQLHKAILNHQARVVFDGKVVIRANAQKAASEQLSKSLLLSSEAEADNKPNLEIYADDVKATHGATVGQLNQEELFYLESRGIDPDTAKELLSLGFLSEIIYRVGNDVMRTALEIALQKRYRGAKV